jgi:hypothetical protein
MHRLERLMDRTMQGVKAAAEGKNRDDMDKLFHKYAEIAGHRQWNNRVSLRREGDTGSQGTSPVITTT